MINFYWSRMPGKYIERLTGNIIPPRSNLVGPSFTGTVRQWCDTLADTIIGSVNLARKEGYKNTHNGCKLRVSPKVYKILENCEEFVAIFEGVEDQYCNHCQCNIQDLNPHKYGKLSNMFLVECDKLVEENIIYVGEFAKVTILDIEAL